jgi:hypothetical protein
LLRRNYSYHVEAGRSIEGLDAVPVQVWSTKSFAAEWEAAVDPASPVVESRIVHPPGDPSRAIGTFVNRIPADAITDCVAFYSGQAYPLGTIVNGQEVRLVFDRGPTSVQWLQERGQLADLLARGHVGSGPAASRPGQPTVSSSFGLPLMGMLFHDSSLRNDEGVVPRNASLRRLDQSWRLTVDNRNEVIVVGRILPAPGTTDAVFGGKDSPTRLRLSGAKNLSGYARQEAYVRIYLKVN